MAIYCHFEEEEERYLWFSKLKNYPTTTAALRAAEYMYMDVSSEY